MANTVYHRVPPLLHLPAYTLHDNAGLQLLVGRSRSGTMASSSGKPANGKAGGKKGKAASAMPDTSWPASSHQKIIHDKYGSYLELAPRTCVLLECKDPSAPGSAAAGSDDSLAAKGKGKAKATGGPPPAARGLACKGEASAAGKGKATQKGKGKGKATEKGKGTGKHPAQNNGNPARVAASDSVGTTGDEWGAPGAIKGEGSTDTLPDSPDADRFPERCWQGKQLRRSCVEPWPWQG